MHRKCSVQGFIIPRETVRLIMKELDPDLVDASLRRFLRRKYSAKGPGSLYHIDGYDKLKPFGICISGCIDGFSRRIIWLNAYQTNNDPTVIGGYFLESITDSNSCPMFVRCDFGTENVRIRTLQQFFAIVNNARNSIEKCYLSGSSSSNQSIESW